MEINNSAPIVPGGGAAAIVLGDLVELVLDRGTVVFVPEKVVTAGISDSGMTRYRSAYVDFWVVDGVVVNIMVHDEYIGKVLGKIGLGSTLADVERLIGPVKAIDDNLVVKGLAGISFEPEIDEFNSPIREIYVWKPDWGEIWDHQST